jgi:hypothetical protein
LFVSFLGLLPTAELGDPAGPAFQGRGCYTRNALALLVHYFWLQEAVCNVEGQLNVSSWPGQSPSACPGLDVIPSSHFSPMVRRDSALCLGDSSPPIPDLRGQRKAGSCPESRVIRGRQAASCFAQHISAICFSNSRKIEGWGCGGEGGFLSTDGFQSHSCIQFTTEKE